jgi:hypothetical protein
MRIEHTLKPSSWFAAWLLVGAAYALGFAAAFALGIYTIVLAVLGGCALAAVPGSTRGMPGFLSGLGVIALVIAGIARDPAWWLVLGVALVVTGIAIFVVNEGRRK